MSILRGWLREALDGLSERVDAAIAELSETNRRGIGWQDSQGAWKALAEKLAAERDTLEANLALAEGVLDELSAAPSSDGSYELSRGPVEEMAKGYFERKQR